MEAVTWKTLQASVEGTSHIRLGLPCQDSHLVEHLVTSEGPILLCCCADGAGSATHSHLGSRQACESLAAQAASWLRDSALRHLTRDRIITWLENVRQELSLTAEELGVPVRELATTFLCAMIGDNDAVFFQVGDGAIIYLDGDRYCHAFWPRAGDYANTTFFLTDQHFAISLDSEVSMRRVDEFALITDGLQMLALDYQLRSVHSPFFSPMFLALRRAMPADLSEPLVAFLNSTPVTDRTDDDKTLILASRVTADEPLLQ